MVRQRHKGLWDLQVSESNQISELQDHQEGLPRKIRRRVEENPDINICPMHVHIPTQTYLEKQHSHIYTHAIFLDNLKPLKKNLVDMYCSLLAYNVGWHLWSPEEGIRFPGTRVTDCQEIACYKSKLDPL